MKILKAIFRFFKRTYLLLLALQLLLMLIQSAIGFVQELLRKK